MGYVGVFLLILLILFIVARIGGLALQMTGMEPDAARFQALSALTGTGFTTAEAERVVRNRTRRKIITILIILGSAGLVALIGTLVVSFTQRTGAEADTGYGWFFIRLGIIIAGIFVLYLLVAASGIGNRVIRWFLRPLMKRALRNQPVVEEIFSVDKGWAVNLISIKEGSKSIGLSVAETAAAGDVQVLSISREDVSITKPGGDDCACIAVYADGDKVRVAWHRVWKGKGRKRDLRLSETVQPYLLAQKQRYHLSGLYYDPYQCAQLAENLWRAGLRCNEVPQTHQNRGPRDTALYDLAINRRLVLYDDPELRSAASFAAAKELGNGLLFLQKSGRGKIDLLVALSNCAYAAIQPRGVFLTFIDDSPPQQQREPVAMTATEAAQLEARREERWARWRMGD